MKRLLVVYNTCGLVRENVSQYLHNINSIFSQKLNDDVVIAVSACCNSDLCKERVLKNFPVFYNNIKTKVPISVSFNHTVMCMDKIMRDVGFEIDDYMFIDSGIFFPEPNMLQDLYDLHKQGFGMTAARTDDDMGFDDWFKTDVYGEDLFRDSHMIVPVGKAVNLHAQIFSKKIADTYGRILPDIFAGQCMESTFSYLTAAVKQKWVVHKDIVLKHITGMDGPSSGFSPAMHVHTTGKPRWDHTFWTKEPMLDIMKRGAKYGMGYEENQRILMHNPDCFEDNLCKNDDLATYIKNNLYCDFDYNSVSFEMLKSQADG